ncbi:EamA family transporter [Candidatus Bathyarchaeota archaeon]|nr:EamA family transporter [Candidatus Bathyarchaeota archaeon]
MIMGMGDKPRLHPNLALLISIVAVSTASILIRWTDAPALTIASYRMVISVLILFPFFIKNHGPERLRKHGTSHLLRLFGVGIVLALHFASWITSLSFTTVASSVIFVHIDPIFVAIISHFFLGDRLTKRALIGIIISFTGIVIIALGDASSLSSTLTGDLLALVGGVMLGIYILGGRVYRKSHDLVTYVTPVYSVAAATLLIMSLATDTKLTGYPIRTFGFFFLIALIPMIFGHTLYNWALRYLSASVVSVSLLGEPVGASILAYLLLGETPSIYTIIGGFITLTGIFLSSYKDRIMKS